MVRLLMTWIIYSTCFPLTNILTTNLVFDAAFLRFNSLLSVTSLSMPDPISIRLTLEEDPWIFSLDVVVFLYRILNQIKFQFTWIYHIYDLVKLISINSFQLTYWTLLILRPFLLLPEVDDKLLHVSQSKIKCRSFTNPRVICRQILLL